MVSVKYSLLIVGYVIILELTQYEVQAGWVSDIVSNTKESISNLGEKIIIDVSKFFQDSTTRKLCTLKTVSDLIKFYGYEAEVHNVTTEDGYILTVFRCNSKQNMARNKRPVVLQHGIVCTSDEFCEHIPSQGLAYVMADAGFDVWIPNARGNFYSRNHVSKDPDDPKSGFWDFSWDDIGLYDYPAVFDYIRNLTDNAKLYSISQSQGTSSMLALLAEKPEYNNYLQAMSLMAPVTYLDNAAKIYRYFKKFTPILQRMEGREIMPRNLMNTVQGTLCRGILSNYCNFMINTLFGQSKNQRNDTMLPTIRCHNPGGSSTTQFLHYGQIIKFGYFGKRMKSMTDPVPNDFALEKITTPTSIHYSTVDSFTDPKDVNRLISKLINVNDLRVQVINGTLFNHADFIWGINAADLVYSDILKFFAKHQ